MKNKNIKGGFFIFTRIFILLFFVLAGVLVGGKAVRAYVIISTDTVWTETQSPIVPNDNVWVQSGVTLTIEPGVVVKLKENQFIAIAGLLKAAGSKSEPIIFTSIRDDEYGGDTNADGNASAPQPGDWYYMNFYNGGVGVLDYVIIKYGGVYRYPGVSYYEGAINTFKSSVSIANSIITNNAGGIRNAQGPLTITNSSIYNNPQPFWKGELFDVAIFNNAGSSSSTVSAINNWWGTSEGPCVFRDFMPPGAPPPKDLDLRAVCGNRPLIDWGVSYAPWLNSEPSQEQSNPVIIVPGILGSWYSNKNGWELDPILHTYDNLYKALMENGDYIPGETLFKFPYEWRQDNALTAYQLKQKIDEIKNICQCGKVDIVAHSMGGLVTRHYIESDNYGNDIDQVVFLGTPHKGSPKSYLTWEGASGFIGPKEWIMKKYFTLEAHARGYDTLFDYIQDYVKSIEQLLPDYAYLKDEGQASFRIYDRISYPNNYPYNTFLEDLNSEENLNKFNTSGVNIFNIIGDTGDNTIGAIELSSGESYWPMWKHGYAEELIKLAGDDTVSEVSSSLFIPTKINGANHLSLPSKAQKQVIEYLTGTMPIYEITETPEPEEALLVSVYSPVDFAVISPSGKKLGKDFINNSDVNEMENSFYSGFESETEFAVIVNPEAGDYQIILQGVANGIYKLGVDIVNKEFTEPEENLIFGAISAGDEEAFNFNYQENGERQKIIIKKDISIDDLEIDLNELLGIGEVRENQAYNYLSAKFRVLGEIYGKIENKGQNQEEQRIDEFAKEASKVIEKLKFYLEKNWITSVAYNVLEYDLASLVIKIKNH